MLRGFSGSLLIFISLLYAIGNLDLAIEDKKQARKVYQKGYDLSHSISATHILTASFLYKLGIIELSDTHFSIALYVIAMVSLHSSLR